MIHYFHFNPIEKFVRDKTVCLVGGAPSILGENLGETIDSYDVVIRVNCHWPMLRFSMNQRAHVICGHEITKEYSLTQIGNRTDILFHGGFNKEGTVEEIEKLVDLKLVALNSRFGKREWEGYNEKEVSLWCSQNNVDFKLLHTNIEGLPSPCTGFIAIDDLLKCQLKKLFICGFDFFKKVDKKMLGSHTPDKEVLLFTELFKTDKRIHVSDHVFDSLPKELLI
jgi:hypothetical protein